MFEINAKDTVRQGLRTWLVEQWELNEYEWSTLRTYSIEARTIQHSLLARSLARHILTNRLSYGRCGKRALRPQTSPRRRPAIKREAAEHLNTVELQPFSLASRRIPENRSADPPLPDDGHDHYLDLPVLVHHSSEPSHTTTTSTSPSRLAAVTDHLPLTLVHDDDNVTS